MRAGAEAVGRWIGLSIGIAILVAFLALSGGVIFRNEGAPYIGDDTFFFIYIGIIIGATAFFSYLAYGRLIQEKIHWVT